MTYPNWVRSAVDLRNPFSFGDTPARGAGQIELGSIITPTQVFLLKRFSQLSRDFTPSAEMIIYLFQRKWPRSETNPAARCQSWSFANALILFAFPPSQHAEACTCLSLCDDLLSLLRSAHFACIFPIISNDTTCVGDMLFSVDLLN